MIEIDLKAIARRCAQEFGWTPEQTYDIPLPQLCMLLGPEGGRMTADGRIKFKSMAEYKAWRDAKGL